MVIMWLMTVFAIGRMSSFTEAEWKRVERGVQEGELTLVAQHPALMAQRNWNAEIFDSGYWYWKKEG